MLRETPTAALKIGDDILKARVRTAGDELRAAGCAALVLYATGSVLGNQSSTHAYLRYLIDFDPRNNSAMLILRPGHAPVLLTATKLHVRPRLAESRLWFDDVRHLTPPEFGEHAVRILKETVAAGARIALIGYAEMPAPAWVALERGLAGVTWDRDFARHIDKHRVCKSAVELSFHRKAAGVCDRMFEALAEQANSDRAGYQLRASMEFVARDAGCDYCDTWLTSGPAADVFRYNLDETRHVPEEGDQLLAGMMLTYDGHWGHAVRTGSIGEPSAVHRAIYDVCREMFDVALDMLKPGVDLCRVNDAMDAVLLRHYPDGDVLRTRTGHGLGYAYEDPVASVAFPNAWEKKPDKRDAVEARAGMLLELHPHLFVPGKGGAMIGDMVLITETDNELLTHHPRDLIEW